MGINRTNTIDVNLTNPVLSLKNIKTFFLFVFWTNLATKLCRKDKFFFFVLSWFVDEKFSLYLIWFEFHFIWNFYYFYLNLAECSYTLKYSFVNWNLLLYSDYRENTIYIKVVRFVYNLNYEFNKLYSSGFCVCLTNVLFNFIQTFMVDFVFFFFCEFYSLKLLWLIELNICLDESMRCIKA